MVASKQLGLARSLRWAVTIAACAVSLSATAQNAADVTSQSGQSGQSLVGVVLKGKAPVNHEVLRVTLPKPVEATLANGMQVVLIEDHKLPTFTMQLVLEGTGDAADAPDRQGVADATAEMLIEGTKTHSSQALAEQLERLGSSIRGATDTLDTKISMSGMTEYLDTLLDLYADAIVHPTFPDAELERFKLRTLSQLQQERADPHFVAHERFVKIIYGDHPAGTLVPSDDIIRKLSSKALSEFHADHYRPNVAVLLVAGDVTMRDLLPKLKRTFGKWQAAKVEPLTLPEIAPSAAPRVSVIDRPNSVQTALILGELGIAGDSPDRYAVAVMNQVLGGGPSSRLFLNLREDKGYTYGAYSSASVDRFPGTLVASADVRTAVTDPAMQQFLYEIKRIAQEPVDKVEMDNAKRAIVGHFALSLENPRTFLHKVFEQKALHLPPDYWDRYAEHIAAVTPEEVQRVAARYFAADKLHIVAVGDAGKIRASLMKYDKLQ